MFVNTSYFDPQDTILCTMKDMIISIIVNQVIQSKTLNNEGLQKQRAALHEGNEDLNKMKQ